MVNSTYGGPLAVTTPPLPLDSLDPPTECVRFAIVTAQPGGSVQPARS